MRKTLLVGIVTIGILAACGNPSLLVPELQDQNPVTIDTMASGSVVSGDSQIPIQLVYSATFKQNNKSPDSMQVQLLASDGSAVRSFAIGADALATQDQFTISLPDLSTGLYTLDLTIYQAGKVLQEKKVQFFHVQGTYGVSGISTYPSTFYPGSSGVLQAHVEAPAGSDPYLRWSMNDKTFAEGLLSDGLDQVMLKAPTSDGAYNVTLELFPMAPASGSTFPFSSSIRQTTEVFVSKTQSTAGEHDLAPAASYYSLFHFRGDYRDVGYRVTMRSGQAPAASLVGTPDLRISGSIFGYHLDGTSGFRVGEVILPFDHQILSPFSLTLRAMADGSEANRTIFSTTSADGTFHFGLRTDEQGVVLADITANGATATVSSGEAMFSGGDPVLLSVSVTPGARSTQFLWFKNGQPVSVSTASVTFERPNVTETQWTPIAGVSYIGVPDTSGTAHGFVGIIDEFGIYFRDVSSRPSTDSEMFASAMAARYGSALVYAQGFGGLYLPDGVETQGPVSVKSGDLVLGPGGSIRFPKFLFERADLVVDLSLDTAAKSGPGEVQFVPIGAANSAQPIFTLSTAGTVVVPVKLLVSLTRSGESVPLSSLKRDRDGHYVVPLAAPVSDRVELRFIHREPGLLVDIQNDAYSLRIADPGFAGVRMSLSQDTTETVPFRIQSVLARKEGGDLSNTLDSVMPSTP